MSYAPMPKIRRQAPKWNELKPLLGFRKITLDPIERRLAKAVTIDDLRLMAKRRTPRSVFDYTDGAADQEASLRRSRELYESVEFRANVLRNISRVDLSATMLGSASTRPFGFAPTGFTRMMHYQGEYAVGHEANLAGIPYALSTMGTTSLEDVAAITPDIARWFQLYVWNDRAASQALVDRAIASGYTALLVTVDTAVAGQRRRDVRNGLTIPPQLTPKTFADMALHPSWWANLLTTPPLEFASLRQSGGTVATMINNMFDPTVTLTMSNSCATCGPESLSSRGSNQLRTGSAPSIWVLMHCGFPITAGVNSIADVPRWRCCHRCARQWEVTSSS
ncbi:MAG: alpha-hydroxy acid oxidase, partial [Antricoccus sp.]